jgi:hypothetical protein
LEQDFLIQEFMLGVVVEEVILLLRQDLEEQEELEEVEQELVKEEEQELQELQILEVEVEVE